MEEVYDLHQHTHTVIVYIRKTRAKIQYFSNSSKDFLGIVVIKKDTFIKYDKQKMNVKNWEMNAAKNNDEDEDDDDEVRIDDFREKLYQVFKKDKDEWNEDDLFLLKAVSDFIRLSVEDLIGASKGQIKSTDQLHYIFMVPSEWEEEIKEVVIKPIFFQSNLISENDHKDRLLFCSELESIFYNLMESKEFDFEKISKTISCRFCPVSEDEMLIKLDLVLTVNRLFDFPTSLLYPKVERSHTLSVTINTFTDGIKAFIKDKLPLDIQEEIIQIVMNTSYYDSSDGSAVKNKEYDLNKPLITDTSKWKLGKRQEDFMESICISNICSQVRNNMTNNIDDLLPNDIIKTYNIFSRVDLFSSEIIPNVNLLNWSEYLLAYDRTHSRNKNIIHTINSYRKEIDTDDITNGSSLYSTNFIINSDIYCRPRILSVKNPSYSSSIFRDSKPDAIMNIDISVESTMLTYSLLNESGVVKEIWNHNDFLRDKSFSETITLNVKSSFIEFAEEYLMGDVSFFSGDKNNVFLRNNATKIETILCNDSYSEDVLVSTQQQIYIKALLLLYMIYIKYVVSSKLSDITDPTMEIKIGYNITVEKILLNRLFDNKEGLKDIIYASGLIQKNDDSKKLRITAQGERIIHLLRRSLALPFPLKSFFVLAQLHENYVQLTLNQVVTESSPGDEDQEAIVLNDEIIHIPNIYTSLCLNMWNNIVENNSLIQLCDRHHEYSFNDSLEILSLKNQAEFIGNLKQYISKDNIGDNLSRPATDKVVIQLSVTCNCRVYLTVCDIIDISFRPVLQDIASLVSASFINKNLFGKLWNIQYLFQLIQFDYNTQLQNSVIKMLKETTEDVMAEQGVDISDYVIPSLLKHLLLPVLNRQPISYKEFRVGALHLVYGDGYGFGFQQEKTDVPLVCKGNTKDTKTVSLNNKTVFPLFKKGDIINDFPRILTFYLYPQEKNYDFNLCFNYFKLKTPHELNSDGTVRFDDVQETIERGRFSKFEEELKAGRAIPLSIYVIYETFAGSIRIEVDLVGQDNSEIKLTDLGSPMHLSRF